MSVMTAEEVIKDSWKKTYRDINEDIFNYNMVKPLPSEWVEAHLILPDSTTVYPGPFTYDWTPYCREIINHLHPNSPVRFVAVMKGSQSGLTAGVVVPGICYIIAVVPESILFTAADLNLAARTVAERLDPILRESGLSELIRPNVIKKGNNRTGDTKYSKEYAGGTFTALGTGSPDSFRYFSCKYAFPDDFDTAPRDLGNEGDVASLIRNRQKSHGRKAKTIFVSTPIATSTSNIYEQVQKGTMKKWHWPCPGCGTYVPVDFQIKKEDGTMAGLVYELDDKNKLIKESIHFKTPCCGHRINYADKYDLNLLGTWISTVETPEEELYESYLLNDIFIPPGFDDWETIVTEWLKANPPGRRPVISLLKNFMNQRLGLPFEEMGETPKVTDLMKNTRNYLPGIIPNETCEKDGNDAIIMITLACDLNGEEKDARLDWEILAHSAAGPTYSVDHGSIGTFMRLRDRSKHDKDYDSGECKIYTYEHGQENSVWPELEEIIKKVYTSENDREYDITISVVDVGFFSKHAMLFITKMQEEGLKVFGIKGRIEEYRKIQRDTQPVQHSKEKPKQLYIAEVNQMKDDLAQMMRLREGEDGSQPAGFMNFPQPNAGKYDFNGYFSHYEGERCVPVMKNGEPIGYMWVKKHSGSQNHYWDVRVYNNCAPLIYLDLVRRSDSKYRFLTWEEFVLMVIG